MLRYTTLARLRTDLLRRSCPQLTDCQRPELLFLPTRTLQFAIAVALRHVVGSDGCSLTELLTVLGLAVKRAEICAEQHGDRAARKALVRADCGRAAAELRGGIWQRVGSGSYLHKSGHTLARALSKARGGCDKGTLTSEGAFADGQRTSRPFSAPSRNRTENLLIKSQLL